MGRALRKIKAFFGQGNSISITEADQELLDRIRKHVDLDAEATSEQRALELDDLRFCDPTTQWDERDRKTREDDGRPCLTEDRLGPFIMQVCNEQRKNKPGVQVNPVDGGADIDTAEVIQGLIRHIEYASNADTAYDTAFEWAVKVGRGFYRVCTDYADTDTFDQEILIKRVPNPHSVFIDPAAQECDYSDANWGGFKTWLSQEDFKAAWPDSQMASAGTEAWQSVGDDAPDWMQKDGGACMVCEYFWKERSEVEIKVGDKTRKAAKIRVKWVKCTAVEILDRGEFPSRYIPIVPVLGKEQIVNGKRTYAGIVRAGKDPQKRHNYLLTSQVERIAFMPLATYIGPKGFMGKEKKVWAAAHKKPIAALEFEVIGDDGQGINQPRLIAEEPPIRAVTEAMMGAEQGMKAVLGMYDPSLGNREGSQSGRAIERLQAQGETGNFHFQDNLSRALRYEGRIILDMLPEVMDTERVVRIVGEDGTQSTVRVNGEPQPTDEGNVREGIARMFDLTTGRYDVTISAGPSYQSKRQEDRALLVSMLNGPMGQQIATVVPDLLAGTLDSPIAKEMAKRFKKLLPPAIQEQGQGQQIPPQAQAQMDQMSQMVEHLTQTVHELQDQIEQQQAKAQGEIEKARIAAQTDIQVATIRAEAEIIKGQLTAQAPGASADAQEMLHQLEDLQHVVLAMHMNLSGMMPPAGPVHEAMEPPSVEAMEPPEGMEVPHMTPSPGGMTLPGTTPEPLA